MNRNKRGVMPEITREVYKNVKKFDRQQFQNFCKDLYGYGFEDGRASAPGVDLTAIYEAIGSTKGIGPKKLDEIKASVEAVFTVGRKQAKIDKDLTDALLANREAIINRNELLVKEVEYLKSIIDLVTKKKNQEEGEKQDGKEESESQL